MSSTYSTNLAIELMGAGEQAGNWGSTTNTNLGTLIEQAISGYTTQAVVTGTDTTITIPSGATGVARNMFIELTGTGGASTNLIVPANKKLYFIYNNSTGAVTVKVSGQTGVSVPATAKMVLVSNGTDIVVATNYMAALTLGTPLAVAQGGTGSTTASTGTGGVVLAVSPTLTGTPLAPTAAPGTNTTQIATTAFVTASTGTLGTMSTQNANNVAITGGTVSSVAVTGGTISGLSSALPVASGGTGVTTSTGSGANVLASSPTLTSPTLTSPTFSGTPGSSLIFRMSSGGLSASGSTSVDFTSMPSWINIITVTFRNISTNSNSNLLVQLGTSSGVTTSGYVSTSIDFDGSGSVTTSSTSGFVMKVNPSSNIINGTMTIAYTGSNAWVNNHTASNSTTIMQVGGGTIALGGTLDRVRITTVSGSDTFNAGTLNVLYQ
jgi:hypothetical protein